MYIGKRMRVKFVNEWMDSYGFLFWTTASSNVFFLSFITIIVNVYCGDQLHFVCECFSFFSLVRFKSVPQSCEPYSDYDYSFWRVMKKRRRRKNTNRMNKWTNYSVGENLSFLKTEPKLMQTCERLNDGSNDEKVVRRKITIRRISDFRLLVESARQATTRRHRLKRIERAIWFSFYLVMSVTMLIVGYIYMYECVWVCVSHQQYSPNQ